jgi:hypothetical protein
MESKLKEGDWLIAQGGTPKRPLMVRIRTRKSDLTYRLQFSELVVIRWRYEPDEHGFPDRPSIDRMDAFEGAINSVLERAEIATQVCCSTGNDFREWMYYTTDQALFMAQFNEALRNHPICPIHIDLYSDMEWAGLQQVVDGIRPESIPSMNGPRDMS